MSPNDAPGQKTPSKKPEFSPSIRRTTSQISTISVEHRDHEIRPAKPFLSHSKATPSLVTTADSASGPSSPTNSKPASIRESTLAQPWSRPTSATTSISSRKGKERAVEPDVEGDVEVAGELAVPGGPQAETVLRRLARSSSSAQVAAPPVTSGNLADTASPMPPGSPARTRHDRKYFVLTNAGKPVFRTSDDSTEDSWTNLMGVAQALISIFAEDDDRIRCIIKGDRRIAFVLKAPLYMFCVSDWGEPEHVLRVHLEYIHLQILSVVTSAQLSKVFQRRSNFDLSRLLEGTENFLHSLITRAQFDFSYLTSTLQPLRMSPVLREAAAASLIPPAKFKDLLYVLLIADGSIVTLLRPKKHSIHPSDLHLVLNVIETSSTLRTGETWLPICLPKFNAAGFVHAYISYITTQIGLVFISADKEAFEDLRGWKDVVVQNLEKEKTLAKIEQSIPSSRYPVSSLECSGLRHFIYKSRQHIQITSPEWPEPYARDGQDRRRLITLYQRLHDSVHGRSGQAGPLKLMYIKSDQEACMAWVTRPFELYIAVSPELPKAAVVSAANTVAKWVAAEEARIFLRDAPVF